MNRICFESESHAPERMRMHLDDADVTAYRGRHDEEGRSSAAKRPHREEYPRNPDFLRARGSTRRSAVTETLIVSLVARHSCIAAFPLHSDFFRERRATVTSNLWLRVTRNVQAKLCPSS
ncbi:hypothetical protein MRX96_003914 [Rhipicephalus microplus]